MPWISSSIPLKVDLSNGETLVASLEGNYKEAGWMSANGVEREKSCQKRQLLIRLYRSLSDIQYTVFEDIPSSIVFTLHVCLLEGRSQPQLKDKCWAGVLGRVSSRSRSFNFHAYVGI